MTKNIIKDGAIVPDDWQFPGELPEGSIPTGKICLSLALWNQHAQTLKTRRDLPGLLLDSSEHPEDFQGPLKQLPLITIQFPAFTDGRGFSLANLLRERYGFRGELRARGFFIRDQLSYLARCGFNSFDFANDQNLDEAIKSLRDFSESYQVAADQAQPLFRRRR